MQQPLELPVLYLRIAEAGRQFGLAPETIRTMVKEGRLKAFKPFKGKGILVSALELDDLIRTSEVKVGAL